MQIIDNLRAEFIFYLSITQFNYKYSYFNRDTCRGKQISASSAEQWTTCLKGLLICVILVLPCHH